MRPESVQITFSARELATVPILVVVEVIYRDKTETIVAYMPNHDV